MTSPALDQINLVVRDMDAALEFYRAVGFDIPPETVWRTASGAHHARVVMANGFELEFDSPALAGAYNRGFRETSAAASGRCVLGMKLATRDAVDRTCEKLAQLGHEVSQPPYDTFWGARYAIVLDPDGNAVGLMSANDPTKRAPPPDI